MAKPRIARQTRCERCILSHRPCDGKQPTCGGCLRSRKGPLVCVYPEGQPSRSEFKARRLQEGNTMKQTSGQEVAQRKEASGIGKGAGAGSHDQLDGAGLSGNASGSGAGSGSKPDGQGLKNYLKRAKRDAEPQEQEREHKKRRLNSNLLAPRNSTDETSLVDMDADAFQHPRSQADGPPNRNTLTNTASRVSSPSTASDHTLSPKQLTRPDEPDDLRALEQLGIDIADKVWARFENEFPKYRGGVLDGLPDLRTLKLPDRSKMSRAAIEREQRDMIRFSNVIYDAFVAQDKRKAEIAAAAARAADKSK